jgi:hypothetical protein
MGKTMTKTTTLAEEEMRGTYDCPICGIDYPHHHPDEKVLAYREDQIHRNDGWTSTAHHQPKERGWYLCLGVEIDPDQYGKKKDFWDHHPLWHQLSWFLWVRSGANAGHNNDEIPEVLYYDQTYSRWSLRNLLGNATRSGAESRKTVFAKPKYWRELPKLRQHKECPCQTKQ